jgi:hypothetical protein
MWLALFKYVYIKIKSVAEARLNVTTGRMGTAMYTPGGCQAANRGRRGICRVAKVGSFLAGTAFSLANM